MRSSYLVPRAAAGLDAAVDKVRYLCFVDRSAVTAQLGAAIRAGKIAPPGNPDFGVDYRAPAEALPGGDKKPAARPRTPGLFYPISRCLAEGAAARGDVTRDQVLDLRFIDGAAVAAKPGAAFSTFQVLRPRHHYFRFENRASAETLASQHEQFPRAPHTKHLSKVFRRNFPNRQVCQRKVAEHD